MEIEKSSNRAVNFRSTINEIISETIDGGSAQSFSYDDAGRLTDDGTLTYTWDRADRLLDTDDGVTTVAYEYNGLGHRVKQDTTDYLLDTVPGLPRVIADKDGSTINRYVFSDHGLLRHQKPDSSWVHPLRDGLGSVRHIVDASLDPVYSVNHTPYGERWNAQGTSPMSFGFTGEWQDPNELLFLRARYYNPSQATFLSLDPLEGGLGDVQTFNRYGYVQANPANLVDPSGLLFEDPPIGCGGGFPGQTDTSDCHERCKDLLQLPEPFTLNRYVRCFAACATPNPLAWDRPTYTQFPVEAALGSDAWNQLFTGSGSGRGCRYFGFESTYYGSTGNYHPGFDLYVPVGTNVRSVTHGIVVGTLTPSTTSQDIAGRLDPDDVGVEQKRYAAIVRHGYTYVIYAHLGSLNVSVGELVDPGSLIGTVGPYDDPGSHLHLEVRTFSQAQTWNGPSSGILDNAFTIPLIWIDPRHYFSGENQDAMDDCVEINGQQKESYQTVQCFGRGGSRSSFGACDRKPDGAP